MKSIEPGDRKVEEKLKPYSTFKNYFLSVPKIGTGKKYHFEMASKTFRRWKTINEFSFQGTYSLKV